MQDYSCKWRYRSEVGDGDERSRDFEGIATRKFKHTTSLESNSSQFFFIISISLILTAFWEWSLKSLGCKFFVILRTIFISLTSRHRSHIFLELSTGGDLFTYIQQQQRLGENEAKYLGFQLIKALVVRRAPFNHDSVI